MKPFTFAFAIVACTGLAFAQTPATANGGGSQRQNTATPAQKPLQKPEQQKKKTRGVINNRPFFGNGGSIAAGVNGSDDCASAPAITGSGNFAFDSTAATTGTAGSQDIRCNNDIWWEWTATLNGDAVFSTCNDTGATAGEATFDTKIHVYNGAGCPADLQASDANNDDGPGCGGFSSHLSAFPVTAGSTYMVQLGGWSAGEVGTGVLAISEAGTPPPAANDECSGAEAIAGDGAFAFDNTAGSTGTEGQNEYICYQFGSSTIDNDVWFAWTADLDGDVVVDTCGGTSMDSKLSISSGSCGALTSLSCNDDTCGLQSSVGCPVSNGSTYYIQVGNFPGATGGTGNINVVQTATPPSGPAGDECSSPIVIAGNVDIAFDTTGATTGTAGSQDPRCNNDIWFEYTADADGNATFSTCNDTGATAGEATFDTKIHVYSGAGCPADGQASDANNDDGAGCGAFSSHLSGFGVTSGSTYMVQLGGWSVGETGTGILSCSIEAVQPPPANDDCATPDAIAGQGSFAYDNTQGTTGAEGQNEGICYDFGSSAVDNDLWFSWTADVTGDATVDTCGSGPDTKISAYDGSGCPSAGSIACNDDTCALQSSITFAVTSGSTYTIQTGNFPGALGGATTLNIAISALPDHPYDDCGTTSGVLADGANLVDTTGASYGSNPASGSNVSSCYTASEDVWYSYTAASSGLVVLALCDLAGNPAADFDTVLSVYDSCGGSEIACNDDYCAFMSALAFQATAGSTYMVNVGGWSAGEVGTGALSVISTLGNPYCVGDGNGTPCPCGNNAPASFLPTGCVNSSASAGTLLGGGSASLSADSVVLVAAGVVPSLPGVFFSGQNAINGGLGIQFGDGLRCAGQNAVRIEVTGSDGNGNAITTVEVSTNGQAFGNTLSVGDVVNYQYWYRQPPGGLCGNSHNLTNALQIVWGA